VPNWNEILIEISAEDARQKAELVPSPFDVIRRKYLRALHEKTQRNIIAYYSAFLTKRNIDCLITDEDKNGFMLCIHELDRGRGLDLLLHTPGGDIAATESLVEYLFAMFGRDIRVIVPQMAMSAGTMIACSAKEVILGKQSCLGPIDPQIDGISAEAILQEVERAHQEINADNSRIVVWHPILNRIPPGFIQRCELARKNAREYLENWLSRSMFADEQDSMQRQKSIGIITRLLTDLSSNKFHERHLHFDDLAGAGLKVSRLELDQTFQDIVLTCHHCFNHSLSQTNALKIIENHNGISYVKVQV
jgi:ATP-dependent protease ClpP protease subunit